MFSELLQIADIVGSAWCQDCLRPITRRVSRKNGGISEKAAAMANHASTRMTQLYDRRRDEVSLDEVERIVI
jgi:integrase/recombinase XerC